MEEKHINFLEISLQKQEQIIDGWGTSLCWWGNIIGRWKNRNQVESINKLLFSPKDGLGINILRYNLGAGENPPNVANFRIGADMPCCLTSNNQWNWENDEPQRSILKEAKKYGANIFEMFLNSPPLWMTKSNSTAGAENGLCNLQENFKKELAEYLTESVVRLKEDDIDIATIAPFNEPVSFWWKSNNNQEGCHFDVEQQSDFIVILAKSMKEKNLSNIGISAPECWSTFESIYCCNHYTEKAWQYITQINTHSYFSDEQSRRELFKISKHLKKSLWMSEVTCGGNQIHDHNDMSSAMELAENITVHLNEMHSQAWVYWQAVENEQMGHNHGLIQANFTGEEKFFITKQYYAFGNYSKFIKQGSAILQVDVPNIVAAWNAEKNQVIIVSINTSDKEKSFEVSFKESKRLKCHKAYRTSEFENLKPIIVYKEDKLTMAGNSITTWIFE